MRFLTTLALALLFTLSLNGCYENAVSPNGSSGLTIDSLIAAPTYVPTGATSLITAKVSGGNGSTLTYEWSATGAFDYLTPMDSICVFTSPSCHYGPAVVTLTVTDGSGASATGSVNLN
jgi:hypothetical protein